jgi:basic membrane protein A
MALPGNRRKTVKNISRSTVVKAFAGSAILALALTGCAAPAATPTATPIDYKACMVSDQGGFKDASFNEEAYNGLTEAKTTLGVQTAQVQSPEKAAAADFVSGVGAMVTAKCNIIINVGFAQPQQQLMQPRQTQTSTLR